ncbi:gluconeogenesis factor YvcK family protein [Alginatibacterium sediminis]|uniref:gluconeogenesis factor YvcK family protein n=1 Tax=Alginatibacterium sediminis TaxID=2164068 RepID=UPI001313F702|nr:uridine diphosphate-N-acetylglucosamine-binding protein YvcK [Alginatibacterium sediminis]
MSNPPSYKLPSPIRVATIGGGTGQFVLLSGLRDVEQLYISAIVSMTDSGGSTGRLRDELGILPPGDILKCVLALSPYREMARDLLLKRFTKGKRLVGHNAGNMLLTMLSQYSGSFSEGIHGLAELLNAKGEILPVTVDKSTLVAELTSGERIFGESAIDIPRGNQREKISNVFLVPHHADQVRVYPTVIERISNVNAIILGPGDLFTSIIPNLLVPGVKEALINSPAKLIYVSNIMTKFGETHGFRLEAFIEALEHYIGRAIDIIVLNNEPADPDILERYQVQQARMVTVDDINQLKANYQVIEAPLLDQDGGIIRHDSDKLSQALLPLLASSL